MVLEARAVWQVPGGGTGYSVFHARVEVGGITEAAASAFLGKVRDLMAACKVLTPLATTISLDTEVRELDTTTGVLQSVMQVPAPAPITGGVNQQYAAPVGARIVWRTPAIVAGRRLQGRTYIVPLVMQNFETDGTLTADAMSALSAAAAAYYDEDWAEGVDPCVWSRTHGMLADITGHAIPDEGAILRGRRD